MKGSIYPYSLPITLFSAGNQMMKFLQKIQRHHRLNQRWLGYCKHIYRRRHPITTPTRLTQHHSTGLAIPMTCMKRDRSAFRSSSSSFSSIAIDNTVVAEDNTTKTAPTLNLWKQLIPTIPIQQILPIGMKMALPTNQQKDQITPSDWANRAAFYGDKVLNYYISQIIRQHQPKSMVLFQEDTLIRNQLSSSGIDLGYVTLVQGEAMSNQLYSNLFATIMGAHPEITSDMMRLAQTQVHDAGTMIEATVDAILNKPPLPFDTTIAKITYTKEDAIAAVQELATYLVHNAFATTTYFNAKGQLLELGGTVIASKTKESSDHAPKFRAIATFRDMSYLSDPPSSTKKMAEQIAATQILNKCQQIRKRPVVKQRLTFTNHQLRDSSNNINESIGDSLTATISTTTAAIGTTGDVDLVTFDANLEELGALPDDFHSLDGLPGGGGVDVDPDDVIGRPLDAKRFQLPKLRKGSQDDFYLFQSSHSVNLKNGESPEMSWRRGAYDKNSCFYRAALSSKMLPHHIETVNSWTRVNSKDLITVVLVLVPKPKPNHIFPTVQCFVRHDMTRTRARTHLGLLANQYINDQVIGGTELDETPRVENVFAPRQPDYQLWPPRKPKS